MKNLPYGVSDFKRIRRNNMYYVDKTMYLPLMEEENCNLFLIRPRRFGKSLFLSMIEAYYDIKTKDRFHELFGDLYIGQHPTSLANTFQMMRFDFSRAGGPIKELENSFNEYCCKQLDNFIMKYREYYEDNVVTGILASTRAESKLNAIASAAERLEHRLYLIIDEYDNFTNDVLSSKGHKIFEDLTHADGFYRRFFKLFKGPFERIFIMGISPVTLDDLTSGFNIDWNISNKPAFNSMLGFEEHEVREMLQYYHENANVPEDIDRIIQEIKPWYDNYCFATRAFGRETVYNCDMALYYLKPMLQEGLPPEEMVDKNIKTDYSKLRALLDLEQGIQKEWRMSDIMEIANKGYIDMQLKSSFPASDLLEEDNFRSLIYYYGMLTIGGMHQGNMRMVIPNQCVRQQYWHFVVNAQKEYHPMNLKPLADLYNRMIFQGDWGATLEYIGSLYRDLSSLRESAREEANVQGFFKALLGICDYALLCPEMELNYGYSDLLLMPLRYRFSDATHCYLIELKYVPPHGTEADIERKYDEAEKQIKQYASSPRLLKAIEGCTLHCLTVLFRGAEMQPPLLILEKEC